MEQEILSEKELQYLTGYMLRTYQRRWLEKNNWHFVESRGGRPLVGRLYARKMLGHEQPEPTNAAPTKPAWTPDFSKVN